MKAYIGLGSNLGEREQQLEQAIMQLHRHPDIHVIGCSSMYETKPVGYVEQDDFLNMVIRVRTALAPLELLRVLLATERELGRIRQFANGPRTIDLDLLLYEGIEMNTAELVLPHPRMFERGFVLIPLLELMEAHQDHTLNVILEHMATCDQDGVVRWREVDWQEESGRFVN